MYVYHMHFTPVKFLKCCCVLQYAFLSYARAPVCVCVFVGGVFVAFKLVDIKNGNKKINNSIHLSHF